MQEVCQETDWLNCLCPNLGLVAPSSGAGPHSGSWALATGVAVKLVFHKPSLGYHTRPKVAK